MVSNRRTVLASIGGIVAGGSLVALTTTQTATAQVDYGTLTIPDREFTQTSEIQDVRIQTTAEYAFDSPQMPDRWILRLLVGKPNGEHTEIAEERMAPTSSSADGSKQLSGSITDTSHFNVDQFRVSSESNSIPISTKLEFQLDIGDTTIAESSVQDTATLTVTPEDINATSELRGSGEIVISR